MAVDDGYSAVDTGASPDRELMTAMHVAECQMDVSRCRLQSVLASTSWRLTAPLRWLPRLFRSRDAAASESFANATIRDRKYSQGYATGLEELQACALAEQSLVACDMLARLATSGRLEYRELLMHPVLDAEPGSRAMASIFVNPVAVPYLARVMADMRGDDGRPAGALALYRHALCVDGVRRWGIHDHVLFVDLLTRAGDTDEAMRHLAGSRLEKRAPMTFRCLLANLLHPHRGGEERAWLAVMNAWYERARLAPLSLVASSVPLLDRVRVTEAKPVALPRPPLVSVIMTVYAGSPDVGLDTAIESILAQTWRNLELVIVDDASPQSTHERLLEWQQRDTRVRVVRAATNRGAYACRNLGMRHVRGEFVTCHDSDDWSHPQKIDLQARHLMKHSSCIANLSLWARVSPSMEFERFSLDSKLVYTNLSSLMFRREPVWGRLGGWDEVRSAADSEFCQRLALVFGHELPVLGRAPMAFGRLHEQSLTHGTLGRGHVSFARRWYRSAWRTWHADLARGKGDPRLPSGGARAFPASGVADLRLVGRASKVDTVVVADFCIPDSRVKPLVSLVERLLQEGRRPVLCQVRTLHTAAVINAGACHRMQQLINRHGLDVVELQMALEADEVLVAAPEVLEFTRYQTSAIRAQRVILVGIDSDGRGDTGRQLLDPALCRREACRLFSNGACNGYAPR